MRKLPPALKHGAYSGVGLLPGEDASAFKKLHEGLIREFDPVGPFANDAVDSVARLLWRKQNLSTYRLARAAKDHYSKMTKKSSSAPIPFLPLLGDRRTPEEVIEQSLKDAEQDRKNEEKARKELAGDPLTLIEIGSIATEEYLMEELAIRDKLDSMIDRYVKRLVQIRVLKSLSKGS